MNLNNVHKAHALATRRGEFERARSQIDNPLILTFAVGQTQLFIPGDESVMASKIRDFARLIIDERIAAIDQNLISLGTTPFGFGADGFARSAYSPPD